MMRGIFQRTLWYLIHSLPRLSARQLILVGAWPGKKNARPALSSARGAGSNQMPGPGRTLLDLFKDYEQSEEKSSFFTLTSSLYHEWSFDALNVSWHTNLKQFIKEKLVFRAGLHKQRISQIRQCFAFYAGLCAGTVRPRRAGPTICSSQPVARTNRAGPGRRSARTNSTSD